MQTTNELLDAVKAANGIPSDYALAPLLGVSRSGVSSYRTRGAILDAEVACRVADLLGVDRAYVVACVEAERAKRAGKEDMAAMWEIVAGKFKAAAKKLTSHAKAAAVFLAVAIFSLFIGGGPDGTARAAEVAAPSPFVSACNRLCIMSNRARRALARARQWLECLFFTSSLRLA